jgi:rRNA pseudouridine-1189 N-methylase Emg1 (Nep1/Mra1 family)
LSKIKQQLLNKEQIPREGSMVVSKSHHSLAELIEESKKREMTLGERTEIVVREFVHEPGNDSIILMNNESCGMPDRFPNYIRTKHGHLWCNDPQILQSQKKVY